MNVAPKPKLAARLVSVLAWTLALAWGLPMMCVLALFYKLFGYPRVEWLSRAYAVGQLALLGIRWRKQVHPAIDPRQPYIFATNHVNHFDHVAMYLATPHPKQGIELDKHFSYPIYGWMMRARGTIPVRPYAKNNRAEITRKMGIEQAAGRSILVFPEGTRTKTGEVGVFRKGVFEMAIELGMPIVPVAVTGMYEVMHKGSYMIRPFGAVTVHCEAPIETRDLSESDAIDLANHVRDIIARRVDAHRATVAEGATNKDPWPKSSLPER